MKLAEQQPIGHHGAIEGKTPATQGLHINKENKGIANNEQGRTK